MDDAPLVFVHGIMGGRLLDERGRVRWIGSRQALGLDRRPLIAPITWGEEQDRDDLVPDGPLGSVLGVPVYGRFLTWVRRRSRDVRGLAYDWRRDLPESVERLRVLLVDLREQHGRPARVVAHSMGGVVTWLLLREHPALASGVLFAGVPFRPGISFGGGMHGGTRIGLNPGLANAAAHCSWTAPYAFFPDGDPQVQGAVEHDWYDADAWQRNGLGVFADPAIDPGPWRAHLGRALACARRTRTLLDQPHPDPQALPPLAVLSGVGRGSVQAVIRDGPAAVRGWDFTSGPSLDGDGAVAVKNSLPPGSPLLSTGTSPRPHQKLLDDLGAVGGLMEVLVGRGG